VLDLSDDLDQDGRQSSFARASLQWDNRRLYGMAAVIAYAAGLLSMHSGTLRWLGIWSLVEVVLMGLPWRVPRGRRSGVSFWAESLCGTVTTVAAIVLVVTDRPGWLTAAGAWPWYLVAVAFAAVLIVLGGLNLRAVIGGELAFVFGPTRRSHSMARSYVTVIGSVGEELVFRAPGALWLSSTPLALLGGVGFVGRHYVPPGSNRRGAVRDTIVELAAAAGLWGLVALSGSIYPAVVCHLLNNLPQLVVELQRETGISDA
jgi:hypothetical protein